jgi:hypothetical protein
MPSYRFVCPICNNLQRLILTPDQAKSGKLPCQWNGCKGILKRAAKPPTARITETLDNGLMPRAIERPADAEQLHNEMAHGKKGLF